MKKLYLLILAVTLIFQSCSAVRTTTSREIKTAKTTVYQKKLIADLEVDVTKKIKGSASVKINGTDQVEGKIGSGDIYMRAKNLAKWDAIEKSNADAIADPIYNITQVGSAVTVEVQGFYSKYKSIDIATNDDLMLYIETKLSSGTGILGVTFDQFQSFYNSKYEVYDIPEEDKLTEVELEMLYDSYVHQALQVEKTSNTTTQKNSGAGKKLLLTYLGIAVVAVIIKVIVS